MMGESEKLFWRATLRRGRTRQSASLQRGSSSSIPTFHYSFSNNSFVYSSSVGGGLTS